MVTPVNEVDPALMPGGLSTVLEWARTLHSSEPDRRLWTMLDDDLRLALTQAWTLNTIGHPDDDLARALAASTLEGPLAEEMFAAYVKRWRQVYKMLAGDFGIWGSPMPISVDMELVILTDPHHIGCVEANTAVSAHSFVVKRQGDEWVIAALARRLPIPGWPPTEEDISGLNG